MSGKHFSKEFLENLIKIHTAMKSNGYKTREVAERFNLAPSTLYSVLRRNKAYKKSNKINRIRRNSESKT